MTLPCASTLPSETPPALQRARGAAALTMRVQAGRTRIAELYQQGCLKLRFPRLPAAEAVLVNTAGGMTGGDRLDIDITVADGAALTVTTQAAERVYRALGGPAQLDVRLTAGPGARLFWLPQETIVYDAAQLRRSLTLDAAPDAVFLLCESVVLGRAAMGETVRAGLLQDNWRLRRAGRLVHAEQARLSGAIEELGRQAATLGGARAFATVIAQVPDASMRLGAVRERLPARVGGASAFEGLLAVRLVAADGYDLRKTLIPVLEVLADAPLPRIWSS